MTGEVKSFSKAKGYGFITSEGQDYRFRSNQWNLVLPPCQGVKVKFDPRRTEKGMRAINIRWWRDDERN